MAVDRSQFTDALLSPAGGQGQSQPQNLFPISMGKASDSSDQSITPDWLNGAYQTATGRDADPQGAQYWMGTGLGRDAITDALMNSPEGLNYETSLGQQYGAPQSWLDIIHQSDPSLQIQNVGDLRTDFTPLWNDPEAIDRMIKGIYGEGTLAGESPEGEQAIMNTMLNRWATNGRQVPNTQRFATSMGGILNPRDYNIFDPRIANPTAYKAMNALAPGNPQYDRLQQMIQDRIFGKTSDNTHGALNYYNPNKSHPSWASAYGNVSNIGQHVFENQIPQSWYAQGQAPVWFDSSKFPTDANVLGPNVNVGAVQPGITDPNGVFDPSTQLADALSQHNSRVNGSFGSDPTTSLIQNASLTGNPGATIFPTLDPATFAQVGPYNGLAFSSGGAQQPTAANPFFDGGLAQGSGTPFLSPQLYPQFNLPSMDFQSPSFDGGGFTGAGV